MIAAIRDFFLRVVGRHLCVLFCAMIPVIELRGSIPIGLALEVPFWENLLLSILGNMIPVPLVLLLIRWILVGMSHVKGLRVISDWLYKKAEKNKPTIDKYGYIGLCLLVAIPLPGTGAWTGSLVASIFHMDFKKSLLAIFIGVLIAAAIVSFITYGGVALFRALFS